MIILLAAAIAAAPPASDEAIIQRHVNNVVAESVAQNAAASESVQLDEHILQCKEYDAARGTQPWSDRDLLQHIRGRGYPATVEMNIFKLCIAFHEGVEWNAGIHAAMRPETPPETRPEK